MHLVGDAIEMPVLVAVAAHLDAVELVVHQVKRIGLPPVVVEAGGRPVARHHQVNPLAKGERPEVMRGPTVVGIEAIVGGGIGGSEVELEVGVRRTAVEDRAVGVVRRNQRLGPDADGVLVVDRHRRRVGDPVLNAIALIKQCPVEGDAVRAHGVALVGAAVQVVDRRVGTGPVQVPDSFIVVVPGHAVRAEDRLARLRGIAPVRPDTRVVGKGRHLHPGVNRVAVGEARGDVHGNAAIVNGGNLIGREGGIPDGKLVHQPEQPVVAVVVADVDIATGNRVRVECLRIDRALALQSAIHEQVDVQHLRTALRQHKSHKVPVAVIDRRAADHVAAIDFNPNRAVGAVRVLHAETPFLPGDVLPPRHDGGVRRRRLDPDRDAARLPVADAFPGQHFGIRSVRVAQVQREPGPARRVGREPPAGAPDRRVVTVACRGRVQQAVLESIVRDRCRPQPLFDLEIQEVRLRVVGEAEVVAIG